MKMTDELTVYEWQADEILGDLFNLRAHNGHLEFDPFIFRQFEAKYDEVVALIAYAIEHKEKNTDD